MNIISPIFDQSHPTWNAVDYDRFTAANQQLIARAMERTIPKQLKFKGHERPKVKGRQELKPDGVPMRAYHAMGPGVIFTAREIATMVDTDSKFISDCMRALIAREMVGKIPNYRNGINGYYRVIASAAE